MPRELEGYIDQYRCLSNRFPNKEAISIKECCEILGGIDRRRLLADRAFPAQKIGGAYIVSLSELARWLCRRK